MSKSVQYLEEGRDERGGWSGWRGGGGEERRKTLLSDTVVVSKGRWPGAIRAEPSHLDPQIHPRDEEDEGDRGREKKIKERLPF